MNRPSPSQTAKIIICIHEHQRLKIKEEIRRWALPPPQYKNIEAANGLLKPENTRDMVEIGFR
jgi:hypothetical protein